MPSLGVVTHVFEEANALPGFLEAATRFFDEVVVYHTGPGGRRSQDGTIEIAEKWGVRLEWGNLDGGFGAVRTQAVRLSSCEWVAILDADERLWPEQSVLSCEGTEGYPQYEHPALTVFRGGVFDHGARLRDRLSDPNVDAVCASRRHWFDFTGRRPCQNWHHIPDYQLRIVRNGGHVGYDASTRMHERCVDFRTGDGPRHVLPDPVYGPFFDHYHCFWKAMEPEQRQADIAYYNQLHEGSVPIGDCNSQ